MATALVTGSAGLIGSEAAGLLCAQGHRVLGLDNDMRRLFFGPDASTAANRLALDAWPTYRHFDVDVRDANAVRRIFSDYSSEISLVVHTAAQPSHEWARRDPLVDFAVNATATVQLLEWTRRYAPGAVFVFTSTNKVYGDAPNRLPLVERDTRWEIDPAHEYASGIDEHMSIDATTHSLFGVSKLAADIAVQEYGRYFGLKTAVFRCGCVTGPAHFGTELHAFLSYLMKCVVTGHAYTVFGYRGKQVRDNIHSRDVANAFLEFWRAPRDGEVYNLGGGRHSHCSVLEAILVCEHIAGRRLHWTYSEAPRRGDHMWYVSSVAKFRAHYPTWTPRSSIQGLLMEIYERNAERWSRTSRSAATEANG